MYGIFLKDCVQFMCSSTTNEVDLTEAVVYTVSGKVNLGFEPHNVYKATIVDRFDYEINRKADVELRLEKSSSAIQKILEQPSTGL